MEREFANVDNMKTFENMTYYDDTTNRTMSGNDAKTDVSTIIPLLLEYNSSMLDNVSTTAPPISIQKQVVPSYDCKLYELIQQGFINVFIVVFGLIGNILVTLTLWNERQKSPTSFLLIVLAFADNMVLIFGGLMMFGIK